MSHTKICPACRKEIPLLAVVCKHCGYNKLPRVSDPRMNLTKPLSSHGQAQGSVPKKTLMMGAAPVARPVGLGAQGRDEVPKDRPTLPPAPAAPAPPAAPSPPPPPEDATELMDSAKVHDWPSDVDDIPDLTDSDLLEEVEDSGLIADLTDRDLVPVEPLEADHESPTRDLSASDLEFEEDEEEEEEDEEERRGIVGFLFRYLLPDELLDLMEEKGAPAAAVKTAGKIRVLHAISAGLGLVVIALVIALVCAAGDDSQTSARVDDAAEAQGAEPAPEAAPAEAEGPAPAPEEAPAEAPPVEAPSAPVAEPGARCGSFASYPQIPWRDTVQSLLRGAGTNGFCGLFGKSPTEVTAAIGDVPAIGPSGIDLLPGGEIVVAFPGGEIRRGAPSIDFLFVGGKLFETRLGYGAEESGSVDAKALAEGLEAEPEQETDHLGRKLTRIADGDVALEIVERGGGRVSLAAASSVMRGSMGADRRRWQEGEAAVAKVEALRAKRRWDQVLEEVGSLKGSIASPAPLLAIEGEVLVRLEAFERAAEIASEILETSREGTTRARARWVAAVAALASGDRDAALEHLRAAAGDDPAAAGARESARELETGSYRAERVALTAARMSCRGKKGDESTVGGILARGNFPDTATYFRALREAKADAAYDAHFEGFVRSECR